MKQLFTVNKFIVLFVFTAVFKTVFAWINPKWAHDCFDAIDGFMWFCIGNYFACHYFGQQSFKKNVILNVAAYALLSFVCVGLVDGVQYSAFCLANHGVHDETILARKQADWDNFQGIYIGIGLVLGLINFVLLGGYVIKHKK